MRIFYEVSLWLLVEMVRENREECLEEAEMELRRREKEWEETGGFESQTKVSREDLDTI